MALDQFGDVFVVADEGRSARGASRKLEKSPENEMVSFVKSEARTSTYYSNRSMRSAVGPRRMP